MRKRMIDPNLWEDPDFGTLKPRSRVLWIGFISHADDEGRGEADPRKIKRNIFGFDDDVGFQDVEKMIVEIDVKMRGIRFYEVDDRLYYQLLNWDAYQTINHPTPSHIPSPDDSSGTNGQSNQKKQHPIYRILDVWAELFPDKTQPRPTTPPVRAKVETRWRDEWFRENWEEALRRAAQSPTLQDEGWFSLRFFLRNEENPRKCYDRWMSWKDEEEHGINPAEQAQEGISLEEVKKAGKIDEDL